jgi:hypothetical protein
MTQISKIRDTHTESDQVASFYRTEDNKFLWVSAVNNQYVHETMVFDAGDASEESVDWTGLVCLPSVFDHAQALAVLGYEISGGGN